MTRCDSPVILLSPYPDEMLASVMARMCRANGLEDFRRLWTIFTGERTGCASFIDAKVSFPSICARAGAFFGSLENLLENCTWVVTQARLGEIDACFLEDMLAGCYQPTLSELTFVNRTQLKFCPRCVEEDVKKCGTAYWHRVHQLPLVTACSEHGDKLHSIVLKRSGLHSNFPLPLDLCSTCDNDVVPNGEVSEWGLEATIGEILADRTFSFDPSVVYSALWDELGARKLLAPGRTLRKAELIQALCVQLRYCSSQPGMELEKLSNQILLSLINPQRGPVLGRGVLIHWLFGSWQAFKERCRWISCLGLPFGVLASRICEARDLETTRQRHRGICMECIQKHPAISRLEFTKTEYRSFHWLLHRDRNWLDIQLPIPKRCGVQLELF